MKYFYRNEVCEQLGISEHSLRKWYVVEGQRMKDENDKVSRLPQPERLSHIKGRPCVWTEKQIEELKVFRDKYLQLGRKGAYGKYTNPKYTLSEERKKNATK